MSANIDQYKREFASFSGKCPYACLHCYTFTPEYHTVGEESISKIVNRLSGKNPDIIYISGHKENFIYPSQGLELGEKLFDAYHCDIMMTTRNVFEENEIKRLAELNYRMNNEGKDLFFCISISALESYKKLESNPAIPTPYQRMEFLSEVYNQGIDTFLTIKPLCPTEYIPIDETLKIIEECKNYSTVVLSSGIVVDDYILKRLKGFPTSFSSEKAPLMECLENNISVQYVNVSEELNKIENICNKYDIPFFQHSMPAVQYVKKIKHKGNNDDNISR